MSSGACTRSSRSRWLPTGSKALTRWIVAPTEPASSVAWRTASPAVSDPSVPTTIDVNITLPPKESARNPVEDHMFSATLTRDTWNRMVNTMGARTRCLVVDDHSVVRQGLDILFGELDDLELVGTVETGEEALDAVARLNPEIVLMDVRLPGIDGVSAVKRIHQTAPGVKFVVFSAYGDKRLLSDAIAAGARGYVMKGSPPEDLLR